MNKLGAVEKGKATIWKSKLRALEVIFHFVCFKADPGYNVWLKPKWEI